MSGLPHLTSDLLESLKGVRHGFFGRRGGVSTGVYESLNCGPYSDDEPGSVEENRRRVLQQLAGRTLVTNRQVHSNRVRVVDAETLPQPSFEGDGLVTRERGICLGALGADCSPVLFADADTGLVGAAHAGWRGALDGVTDRVVDAMVDLGADPSRIVCAVGPSIQLASYQVGVDFARRFRSMSPLDCEDCFHWTPDGEDCYFNLPGYIRKRLRAAGISAVDAQAEDTYVLEQEFFSYRRNCHQGLQDYGRQIGVIMLE